MKLSKFKFNLPQELIALHPAKNRDESRLMIVNRKTGEIEHKVFKDLLSYFGEKDVFIFNKDRKSTRLNSSHNNQSRMPSSA